MPKPSDAKNVFEMMKEHRTLGFSPLIKRRFIIGSYVLQKENQERYFKNAARVRRIIVDKMKELLESTLTKRKEYRYTFSRRSI